MDVFTLFILSVLCLVLAFALLSNLARDRAEYEFELKPNCLLTRHPVVFLTGPRSFFYFRKYWNGFPALLAEHGYEVFTVHLPWKGVHRAKRLQEFLNQQELNNRKFHFILDTVTQKEFATLLNTSASVLSQTVPRGQIIATNVKSSTKKSLIALISFQLHRRMFSKLELPSPADVGLEFPNGTSHLLQRMQELGEQDFLRE